MKWLLLIFLFYYVKCKVIKEGNCPELPIVNNFNKDKFLGEWYGIKAYEDEFTKDYVCGRNVLKSWNDNLLEGVWYSFHKTSNGTLEIPFVASLRDNTGLAKFRTTFTFLGVEHSMDSQIIDVDYDNYLVLWDCKEENGKAISHLWVKSRHKTLPEKFLKKVTDVIKKHNLLLESPILKDNC